MLLYLALKEPLKAALLHLLCLQVKMSIDFHFILVLQVEVIFINDWVVFHHYNKYQYRRASQTLATGNIFQGNEKETIVSFLLSLHLSTPFTVLCLFSFPFSVSHYFCSVLADEVVCQRLFQYIGITEESCGKS